MSSIVTKRTRNGLNVALRRVQFFNAVLDSIENSLTDRNTRSPELVQQWRLAAQGLMEAREVRTEAAAKLRRRRPVKRIDKLASKLSEALTRKVLARPPVDDEELDS